MSPVLWILTTVIASCRGQTGISVTRTTGAPPATPVLPLTFDTTLFNQNANFNAADGVFTVPETGVYFVSYGAGAAAGKGINYELTTGTDPVFVAHSNVYKTNTNTNGTDAGSRATAAYVTSVEQFAMGLGGEAFTELDSNCVFGITFFNVLRLNDETSAFSVGRTSPLFGTQNPLNFTTTLLNRGLLWNEASNTVVTTQSGLYFLSLSAGTMTETPLDLTIDHKGSSIAGLTRGSVAHNGVDTISRSLLAMLETTDEVKVIQNAGSGVWADGAFQTSLTGFMVASTQQFTWPAFFVARSTSWSGTNTQAPLDFDVISVNEEGLFDPTDNKMKVTRTGAYYISISAGLQGFRQVLMTLRLNGAFVAAVYSGSTTHTGTSTLSRDVILNLEDGDVLHVEADSNGALYSDAFGLQTSFLAFMVPLPPTK